MQVDLGEGVETSALGGRRQQRLVAVLPVQVDECARRLVERRQRRHTTVYVGPRPTRHRDGSGKNQVVAVVASFRADESTFDDGFGGTRPDQDGIGPTPQQKLDGFDDEGFSSPSFSGQSDHPGPEHQTQISDNSEFFHP